MTISRRSDCWLSRDEGRSWTRQLEAGLAAASDAKASMAVGSASSQSQLLGAMFFFSSRLCFSASPAR